MNGTRPDDLARGFAPGPVDPFRYANHPDDPREAPGMIARLVPERGRVLDVGCGVGATLELVSMHRDVDLVGLEPQPERAARARQRGFEVYTRELTATTRRELGRFDAVLFVDVLEHLPDPVAALELSRDVLERDGRVLASIPNVAHWTVRRNLLRGRFDYAPEGILDATHLRFFTEAGVRRLFRSAGFALEWLGVSTGVTGVEYRTAAPFCWLKKRHRAPFIHLAARHFPRLFGYQFVVSARPVPAR